MPSENAMKVCLVAISLGKGGAERSTALLSQMLEMRGHEVHIVILNNLIDYPFSGKIFNLGTQKDGKDSAPKRFRRFKQLRAYLKKENFDFIIDNRTRMSLGKEWFYLHYLYRGFNTIYVIRSANLDLYLPKNKWMVKKMISKSFRIVAVSEQIANKINDQFSTTKAVCIYNPVMEVSGTANKIKEKFILYLGRLEDEVKNISLLLESYKLSKLPENDIHLKILGDGTDREMLIGKSNALGIATSTQFLRFTPDVYPLLKNALFTVLTSRYEGFPRALVESLSVGTPVVSVDCESGPNEIIENGENGLLVENYNTDALATAFNRMIEDEELYARCKKNSKKSIAHLSLQNIAAEWDKLLKNEK